VNNGKTRTLLGLQSTLACERDDPCWDADAKSRHEDGVPEYGADIQSVIEHGE
jgi:hypothetical protein